MDRYAELLYRVAVVGGVLAVTSLSLAFARRDQRQRGGWPRVALAAGVALGLVMMASAAAGGVWRTYTLHRFLNATKKVEVPNLRPAAQRPPLEPVNFLVLGSDSRTLGTYAQDGVEPETGSRADVLMVVKIDPEGGRAKLLSIPRDFYVEIPGYGPSKINAALDLGGPELQVTAVEDLTGIRIDHYVEVDFQGFVRIVDEFGGVDLCVDAAMRDFVVGVHIPAGCTHFDGINALNFVRSRHADFERDGVWEADLEGDLSRIRRQQHFLDQLLARALARSAVASYPRYADAIGQALTFDSTFGIGDLVQLVEGFARPSRDAITYFALPGIADDYRGVSYVFAKTPEADEVLISLGGHPVPDSALPFGRESR